MAEKAYWDAHERARERDAALFLDYGASRPSVVSRGPIPQRALGDQVDGFPMDDSGMMMEGDSYIEPIQPMEVPPADILNGKKPEVIPTPNAESNGGHSSAIRSRLQSVGQNRLDGSASSSDRVTQASVLVNKQTSNDSVQWTARSNQGRVGTGVGSASSNTANPLRNASEWSQQNGSLPANGLRNP